MPLIKAYAALTREDQITKLRHEVVRLSLDDPRRNVFESAIENAEYTINVEIKDVAKWLADYGYVVPEYVEDQKQRVWDYLTTGGIQSNLCSPRDFALTHHHIRWFAVRGFIA